MVETADRSVVVLGGGVVGIASAYYLSQAGFRVTVIERREAAGLETSFANGGLVTASMSDPWPSPATLRLVLKWLGRDDAPFLIRARAVPGLTGWGLRFLRQCTHASWRGNLETTLRLSLYSQRCLGELRQETGIEFDLNWSGILQFFSNTESMDRARRIADILHGHGVAFQPLDAAACIALEPALASQADRILGGLHYTGDFAGDAHLFTQRLAALCADRGVSLRYGESARSVEVRGGAVSGVLTDKGRLPADACLVALGNQSRELVRPLGIRLAIYPVKGYSLTFPVEGWNGAPKVPLSDDGRKIGAIRLGDRIRVAGTAEFVGYDTALNRERLDNLKQHFAALCPDYPDLERGSEWAGLRPTTPDCLPYLGQTPVPGLFLNTGHGHLGWTMSCGSGKLVSDTILGRPTEIDMAGLTLQGR